MLVNGVDRGLDEAAVSYIFEAPLASELKAVRVRRSIWQCKCLHLLCYLLNNVEALLKVSGGEQNLYELGSVLSWRRHERASRSR